MENRLLKMPYKFKNSYMYGGTPEPQTTQDAPWLHRPSLKIHAQYQCKIVYLSITRPEQFTLVYRCFVLNISEERYTRP
jgi:hypothetical protein